MKDKYYSAKYGKLLRQKYGDISFKSFIMMILDNKKCQQNVSECNLDVHWKPFYSRCCYCCLPYKYFVKLETMATDVEFIAKLANVTMNELGNIKIENS